MLACFNLLSLFFWVFSVSVVQLFNTQAQSLLLMTSVAMPVFSKKEETVSSDCFTKLQWISASSWLKRKLIILPLMHKSIIKNCDNP